MLFRCFQEVKCGDKVERCSIKGFICTKDNILCTVCEKNISEGCVLLIHPNCTFNSYRGKYCCSSVTCYTGTPVCRKAAFISNCSKCQQQIARGDNIRPANDGEATRSKIFIHDQCPPVKDEEEEINLKLKRQRLCDMAADTEGETEESEFSR